MPSLTVLERYGQVGEFAALLGAAELNAEGETPDLNTYRVTVAEKAPAEAPITLE
ncbi:TPA: hypothetical protein ACIR09_004174 [Pseudomonas aeruginosa]